MAKVQPLDVERELLEAFRHYGLVNEYLVKVLPAAPIFVECVVCSITSPRPIALQRDGPAGPATDDAAHVPPARAARLRG